MTDCSYNHDKSWSENLETHQHVHEGLAKKAQAKLDQLNARPKTGTQLDELTTSEIAQQEREVSRHTGHAEVAEQEGKVWNDPDPAWQMTHQKLRAEAGRRGKLLEGTMAGDGSKGMVRRGNSAWKPGAPTS
jgi:hypothetical protein